MSTIYPHFYAAANKGVEARNAAEEAWHSRRLSRRIDRRLVRHGLEVVKPRPRTMMEVYGCLTTRWREGSPEDCLMRATQVMAGVELNPAMVSEHRLKGWGRRAV